MARDDRLFRAVGEWERGEGAKAVALLREVVATGDPTVVPEASFLLGMVLEEEDTAGARAAYQSVVDSADPVFCQPASLALGRLLTTVGDWGTAHRMLTLAASGPDPEVAALGDIALALVLSEMGDISGSRGALDRARGSGVSRAVDLAEQMEVSPGTRPSRQVLLFTLHQAEGLAENGSAAAAAAVYRKLLTCGDRELVSEAAFRLYSLYAQDEEYEAAREVIERAIAVGDPDRLSEAHYLLGAVLGDLGEHAAARDAYDRAAEDPNPGVRLLALIEQAKTNAFLGDEEAAKANLRRVIASGHDEFVVSAQACLGQMHTEAGEVDEALTAWEAVLGAGESATPARLESEHATTAVAFLETLRAQVEPGSAQHGRIMDLLRAATEHSDPDVVLRASLLINHAEWQKPLADPVAEQTVQDTDAGIERLRAGDLAGARAVLRRAADAGVPGLSERALLVLAKLEIGEGDLEQADELLTSVAEGADIGGGLVATVLLVLLRAPGPVLHPVVEAAAAHQRLGRDAGMRAYEPLLDHDDPAIVGPAKVCLAQIALEVSPDIAVMTRMLRSAADSGDPLALSFAAVLFHELLALRNDTDAAIDPLRRAWKEGHPELSPWVAHSLAQLIDGDGAEVRAACETAITARNSGVRRRAQLRLAEVLESTQDLLSLCDLYEQVIEEGDPDDDPGRSDRYAWLLGFARLRVDDLAGARDAFGRIPPAHSEYALYGAFARALLDRDFDAAWTALTALRERDDEVAYDLSTRLAMETAHSWQRWGRPDATDRALSLAAHVGHPDFTQRAWMFLGALRDEAGDTRGALDAWLQTAEVREENDERLEDVATYRIGRARRALGDLDGAAEALEQVLGGLDDDEDKNAARQYTEVLAEQGRTAEARERFENWGHEGSLILARALHHAGRGEAAIELCREVADASEPETAVPAALDLAGWLAERGDKADAADACRRAIAIYEAWDPPMEQDDDDRRYLRNAAASAAHFLGVQLAALGDLAGAAEAFERAATHPQLAGSALFELGKRLADAGDAKAARAVFERVAALDDFQYACQARAELGTATENERAWAMFAAGDRAGALAAFTRMHGSADMAGLNLAIAERDMPAAHSLLSRLAADPAHADAACRRAITDARDLRAQGETDAAKTLYRNLIELGDPYHAASARINFAAILGDDYGQHSRAEWLIRPVTGSADTELAATAWHNIGVNRRDVGDLAGAARAFRRAMEAGDLETAVGAVNLLADVLEARDETGEMCAVLDYGASLDHPDALVFVDRLMFALLGEQDFAGAARRARLLVASGDPDFVPRGHWGLAMADGGAGDPAAAETHFRNGIAASRPDDLLLGRLRIELARLLRDDRGDLAAARRELAAVSEDDVHHTARVHFYLGVWHLADGEFAEATHAFERALTVAAEDDSIAADALHNLGVVARRLHEAGDHREAVRTLAVTAGVGGVRTAVDTAKDLAAQCAEDGDLDGARRYFRGAREFTGDPWLELDLADLLDKHGEITEAREIYERITGNEEHSLRVVAGSRLVDRFQESGEYDAIDDVLARVADADANPDLARAVDLHTLRQNAGKGDERAMRDLRAAAADGDPTALSMLAGALAEVGDVAEARALYRRVIDSAGTEDVAADMYRLGRTYHDEDEAEARKWYLCVLETKNREVAELAVMMLGGLAKRNRDFPEARKWYGQAIDSGSPQAPLAAAHLGELCYWLGDRDGTVRHYELTLAMTESPDLVAEATYRLGEISHRDGDVTEARRLLTQSMDTGDPAFAERARELLAKLT